MHNVKNPKNPKNPKTPRDALEDIKNKLLMKYPNVTMTRELIMQARSYEKIGADLLSDDVYISNYNGVGKMMHTIGFTRKLAVKCIGRYGVSFFFVIKKDDTPIERAYFTDDEKPYIQGCTAIIEYHQSGHKYTVSNYSCLKEFKKVNRNGKSDGLWDLKTSEMLKKVAEAGALRRVLSELNQKYLPEEMDDVHDTNDMEVATETTAEVAATVETIDLLPNIELTDSQYDRICMFQRQLGYSDIKSKEELIRWLTYSYKQAIPAEDRAKAYYDYLQKTLTKRAKEWTGQ